jgi:hypothetical protein
MFVVERWRPGALLAGERPSENVINANNAAHRCNEALVRPKVWLEVITTISGVKRKEYKAKVTPEKKCTKVKVDCFVI